MKSLVDILKIIQRTDVSQLSDETKFLYGSHYLPSNFKELKESIKNMWRWR